jgi:hypothetical protein
MQGLGLIVIMFFFGLGSALVARSKGNPVAIWFAVGFFVPLVGLMAAIFARSAVDDPRRFCENCGKVLPITDTLCTGCGSDLDFPDDVIPSRRTELRMQRC